MQKVEANFETPKLQATEQNSSVRLLADSQQSSAAQKADCTQPKSLLSQIEQQTILDNSIGIDIFGGFSQNRPKACEQAANPFSRPDGAVRKTDEKEWKFAPHSETLSEEGQAQNASDFIQLNMKKLDQSGDGAISRNEVQNSLKHETSTEGKRQLENILENFDELKGANKFDLKDGITMKDAIRTRQELAIEVGIETLADGLLTGRDALFFALDSATEGKSDGKITKMDLVNFIFECKKLEKEHNNNDGIHWPENAAIAQKMLNEWHKRDSPTNRIVELSALDVLTGGSGAITAESLAKKLDDPRPLNGNSGFRQAQELIKRHNQWH